MAIYKLAYPVKFNVLVMPVRLLTEAQSHATFADELGTVSGWEREDRTFKCTAVTFQQPKETTTLHSTAYLSTNTFSGEQGSPVVIYENGTATQVGIHMAKSGSTLVATRIGPELNWLNSVTGIAIRQ